MLAIKHVEDFAAYSEPISNIQTLQNGAIMSLGAIRRSIYDRGDDSVPTTEEEQFAAQADDATKIVELTLKISQSSPAESADIIRMIYFQFTLLFSDIDEELCKSLLDDIEKLYAFSLIDGWDDHTLVAPQIFYRDLPTIEEENRPERLIESLNAPDPWYWFYGLFYIVMAYSLQFKHAPELQGMLWYGATLIALCWAILALLFIVQSRWAIGVYLFTSIALGSYAIYFGLVDEFTPNRIVILIYSFFSLCAYHNVVDAVKK